MKRKLLPIWITLLLLTTLIPLTTNTVSAASFDTGWVACGTVTQDSSGDKTWGQNENFNVSNIENDDGQPNDIYLDYSAPAKDYDVYLLNETGATDGNDKAYKTYNWGSWDTASYGSSSDTWGLSLTPSIVNNINFGVALKYIYDDDASPKISNFMECSNFSFSIPVGATITGVEVATEVKANTVHEVDYVWMKVYYTANTAPTQSNENPANESTNQDTAFTWNTTISDPEGDSMNWSIECSNGQSNSSTGASNGSIELDLTGLSCCENYTVWVNVTDGSIWTNESYWFLTRCGTSPTTTNPSPADASTDQWPSSLSATVEDPEGDTFSWTIETSPDIGSNSGSGTNGSKTCTISQLPDNMEYDTTYTWWVNTTDSPCGNTSSTSFTFTTPYPVETRAPTGEQKYNATLNGWLNYTWLVNTSYGFLLWDWDNESIYTNITVADYDYLASYDVDNNRIVSNTDLNDFWGLLPGGYPQVPCVDCEYDYTGDGDITFLDLSWWISNIATGTPSVEFADDTLEDFNYSYNKEDLHDTWHYEYKAWLNGSYYEGEDYHLFTKPTPPTNFKIKDRDGNLITFNWFSPECNDYDNLTTVLVYDTEECPTNVTDGTWLVETSGTSYTYEFPLSPTENYYISAFTNFTGNYSDATCLAFDTEGGNYTINIREENANHNWRWTNLTDVNLVGRHKFVVHYEDGTTESNEFNCQVWNNLPTWEQAFNNFKEELEDLEDYLESLYSPQNCSYIDNVVIEGKQEDDYDGFKFDEIQYQYKTASLGALPGWEDFTVPGGAFGLDITGYYKKFKFDVACGDEYVNLGVGPVGSINVYDGDGTLVTTLPFTGSGQQNNIYGLADDEETLWLLYKIDAEWDFGILHYEDSTTLYDLDDVNFKLYYGATQKESKVYSPGTSTSWKDLQQHSTDFHLDLTSKKYYAITPKIKMYGDAYTYDFGVAKSTTNLVLHDFILNLHPILETLNPDTYTILNPYAYKANVAYGDGADGEIEETWNIYDEDLIGPPLYAFLRYNGAWDDYITISPSDLPSVGNTVGVEGDKQCNNFNLWDEGLSTNFSNWLGDDIPDLDIDQANFTEWWNNVSGNLSDWLDDYTIDLPEIDLPQIPGLDPKLGWTGESPLEDPDPHDGKFWLNVTKRIDWVEFIWSESETIFNISWNASDYCHRKLVVNDQMRLDDSITFWIRNDLLRSRYGTSIPGIALADYVFSFLSIQEGSYVVIYRYDGDGNEILVHSEYVKNNQIKPMLIFGDTYQVRVIEPDGNVVELGEFTAESERDIIFNVIEGVRENIYSYCDIDATSLTDGFQISFYDTTATCDWVQFIIYNTNGIQVYDSGKIFDAFDYDFQFTSAEGYEDGKSYYYRVVTKLPTFPYTLSTPLLPFYADNEFDGGTDSDSVNNIFFFIFGQTPFRTSGASLSYAYAITFILMMIGLLAFTKATYLGLIVEGFIAMGCTTIFGFATIQQVSLASIGVFLITIGILAALAGKRSKVGGNK